jgi:hypothetical protein
MLKEKKLLVTALSAIALFTTAIQADTETDCSRRDSKEHASVNSRPIPASERVEIQEGRAQMQEEAKKEDQLQLSRGDQFKASEKELKSSFSYGIGFGLQYPLAVHNPTSISIKGDLIEIEDGSIWSTYYGDACKLIDWIPASSSSGHVTLSGDPIVISQNTSWFSIYNYRIHNLNTGNSVRANLSLGPISGSYYTRNILAIDYDYGYIQLNDGTIWSVSNDRRILNRWFIGDAIIIGVNDAWFTWGRPYILIDVETDSYLTASLN